MINRALTYINKTNSLNIESNNIRSIAKYNGFSPKERYNLIDKIKYKFYNKEKNPLQQSFWKNNKDNTTNYISLPYNSFSNNISKHIKKYYKIAFRTNNKKISHIITKNKTLDTIRENKYKGKGVYMMECGNDHCNDFYIGMTTRSFIERYREHKRDGVKDEARSNYATHVRSNEHDFIPIEKVKILKAFNNNNEKDVNTMEKLYIYIF